MIPDGPIERAAVRASPVPLDRIPRDHEHCLLCGSPLGEEGTEEHVFPQWLQHRYDLWDHKLVLLNGTAIPYRSLKVPCCVTCNRESLSQLERDVSGAVDAGYSAVAALPAIRLFQWGAKILLGILFKELVLARDRADRGQGTILTEAEFDEYVTIHDLLQTVRVPAKLLGGPFHSSLVCRLHDPGESHAFNFMDNIEEEVVALRMGEVGIIVSLADGGLAEEHWGPVVATFGDNPMHPIQFDELVAHVVYVRRQMTGSVRRVVTANSDDGSNLAFIRLPGFSTNPPLAPFDPDLLRPYLRHHLRHWGRAAEDVWTRENGVGTTIFASEGHVAICDARFEVVETRAVAR